MDLAEGLVSHVGCLRDGLFLGVDEGLAVLDELDDALALGVVPVDGLQSPAPADNSGC